MKKYILPLLAGLVLFAPNAHALELKAAANTVEQVNLDSGASAAQPAPKPKASKKPAKPKPKAKKSTKSTAPKKSTAKPATKAPAKSKSATKKPKKTTAKSKTSSAVNVNTSDLKSADLSEGKSKSVDDPSIEEAKAGDGNALDSGNKAQVKIKPEADLPEAQKEEGSSSKKGLAVAGISGLSGLGLMLLLKRIFFH